MRNNYVGEVSYNGYRFPAPLSAKVRSDVVMDSDERIAKYIRYVIDLTVVIVSEDAPQNDSLPITKNMDDVRRKLLEPGGHLIFNLQGFGSLEVNNDNYRIGYRDIKYGPKPRALAWEPIGSNRAVRIVWQCEINIPECENVNLEDLINFEYEVEWSTDESGITERRIIGELEIPVRWSSFFATAIPSNNADAYRDRLDKFPRLDGFARSFPMINLSKNRSVLTFAISDREIPSDNPYSPGMISMDIDHTIKSQLHGSGFIKWICTISGSVTIAPGLPKTLAWNAIVSVISQRLDHVIDKKVGSINEVLNIDKTVSKSTPVIFVLAVSISEEIFGRSVSFSITYQLISTPKNLLGDNGTSALFTNVGTSTWGEWNEKLFERVQNSRGWRKLGHSILNDKKISLCAKAEPGGYAIGDLPSTPDPSYALLTTPCPDTPGDSWQDFGGSIEITYDGGAIRHQRLKYLTESDYTKDEAIRAKDNATKTGTTLKKTGVSDSSNTKYQYRTEGLCSVVVRGYAVRLKYDIPIPAVKSVGKKTAIKDHFKVKHEVIGAGECPLLMTSWVLKYTLDGIPEGNLAIEFETNAMDDKVIQKG